MCECFARVFGVSWSPAASYAAEGQVPESHVFRTRQQAAAQKEKLHAELKRVLQRKGESQRSSEEAGAAEEEERGEPLAPVKMEAQLSSMEKTIETSELLEIIVETEAEAGVSGMSVAGGGKSGLFVKDILKDSPAARALSLREGDQLLSARVYFDNIKYEDALQILKCAEPYKISFCLKRTVPSTDVSRKPGATTFEVRGPKAKMAKLNIQSLTSLKKKKKKKKVAAAAAKAKDLQAASGASWSGDLAGGKLDVAPVDVEFSLPKFSKLRKAKSAGEVAVSEPSPDTSPRLSSLETKRRRLKFPRLKVKEAAAARAKGAGGWLEVGLPKAAAEAKAAGGLSRFSVPFGKAKRAEAKAESNFQAPQVELDLPLPKAGPGRGSPKGRVQATQFGLPKVSGVEIPEGGLQGGLKLPVAEVAAPKVDVDLSFPGLERAALEMTPKGKGFKIRVSAEDAELEAPSVKVPAVEVALGKKEEREEKLKAGVALPPLEVGIPSVELEIPLPKGKAEVELPKARVEVPDVSVKVPLLSLPKLGSRASLEKGEEGRLPQVELSMGRHESPKAKAKGPKIQLPGFGISLTECKPESKEGAVFPEVKVPSLDIALPKVGDVPLPRPMVEVAAPTGRPKSGEVAEAPGFKFQVPQVSLPKFDLSAKADSLPQMHTQAPRLEGEASVKVSIPKVDLSLPAMRLPDMELPKAPVPRPELDISVEKPRVEVAVPAARLSCPSAVVPALDIDLPKVGLELDLPKVEREPAASKQLPRGHEVKLRVPSPKAVSRDLEVEISVPTCQGGLPEAEPRERVLEGPDVSGMVAKIPKVDLSLGKALPGVEGAAESSLAVKGQPWPKVGLEVEGAKVKLPSVEIPSVKIPDVTLEGSKTLEAEASIKAPRFTLPKFSIPGPKAWAGRPEASAPEAEGGVEAKLKVPKFGISFPKSKVDVEGMAPKGRAAAALEAHGGVELPAVEVIVPAVDVDLGLPAWPGEKPSGTPLPEAGVELPDIKLKVPKFSLPKFRGKGKEGDLAFESQEGKLRGSREALAGDLGTKAPEKEAKASKFKMPSFGLMRRDTAGMEAETKKAPGSPKEKPKGGHFAKMPRLKLSSPKVEADRGKLAHLQAPPELEVKVPQVELPRIGARDEVGLAVGAESPTLKVKVPSLEISMPSSRGEGEKPAVDVSEADLRGYEGELKIPRVSSVGISTPKLELEVSLPTAGVEEPTLPAEVKIKLPQVELPRFGRAEEGGAEVQLLGGRRLSFGEEGGEGALDTSLLGTKIRLPRVDLSLPKGRLSDTELPLTAEGGEVVPEGSEAKFRMPSVGLPKFSTPRVKAPEVELEVGSEAGKGLRAKAGGPVIRLAKFGGSTSDREVEAEADLPRVPQLELKAPKLRGSAEALSPEAKEAARIKMPSVPIGFGLAKGEAEARGSSEEGKFKIKLPSLGLSKAGADTQPLCPPPEGPDFSFKMPQIALPDVGFSVDQEGKSEAAQWEAGKLPDLDVEVGGFEARLKAPQIKVPAVELLGHQGDGAPPPGRQGSGGDEAEGKRAAFHVPGVELSAPSLKAHAEYQVEGAQLRHGSSQELRGGQGGEAPEAEVGKRYKVKIPKFGLSLPKGGAEGGEGPPGHEGGAKVKRPTFGLGRAKGRGAEGLLEGEGEEADGSKGVMAKLKLKPPTFGLSLSPKAKGGSAEVNGELEDGSPLKMKVPKLGFSKGEGGPQVNGEQAGASLHNGAKLGKIRLPQVELSSPPKMAGADLELNLELVRAEEAKDEAPGAGRGALAALKAAKFKSPKISFSGFRKRTGEGAAGAVVSSAARVEMSSLEVAEMGAKGERSPKSRFPKVALSPKAQGGLEGGSELSEGGLRIKLPSVGFSGEHEGQVLEGRAVGARGEAGEATV
ncbi:periaxin isoform X2 [Lacerta agilis]|uniref:periaxin isoform X2 n=1 Tax=Lacerta agilis TaxID=80427 RepID=UPI00141A6518|nr:periaxin isoform X2 [Lacerta agilis]